jgi:hypothetical protein
MNLESLLALPLNGYYFISVAGTASVAAWQGTNTIGVPTTTGQKTTIPAAAGTAVTLSSVLSAGSPIPVGAIVTFSADVYLGMYDAISQIPAFTVSALTSDMAAANPGERYILLPAGTYRIGGIFGVAGD